MKHMQLTQGKSAIVDDKDFEFLNQWKWYYHHGYAARGVYKKGKTRVIFMHRVINQTPFRYETDHINENKLDNRRKNLRTVTSQQNKFNIKKRKTNISGYKGVSWNKNTKKWRATITFNYQSIHLGLFDKIEDAAVARKKGEEKYFYSR